MVNNKTNVYQGYPSGGGCGGVQQDLLQGLRVRQRWIQEETGMITLTILDVVDVSDIRYCIFIFGFRWDISHLLPDVPGRISVRRLDIWYSVGFRPDIRFGIGLAGYPVYKLG